jgi:chorismate-pyruvate lyase
LKNFVVEDSASRAGDPERYSYHPLEGFFQSGRSPETGGLSNGINFASIPPILRALLASDGTVTKLLEAYFFEPVEVKRLFHGDYVLDKDLPPLELARGEQVLRREVVCRGVFSGRAFCHALSFIQPHQLWPGASDDLLKGRLGIGELLREHRVETYRELLTCQSGPAGDLSGHLETTPQDMLISRTYRIHIARKPSLWIADTFPVSHFR